MSPLRKRAVNCLSPRKGGGLQAMILGGIVIAAIVAVLGVMRAASIRKPTGSISANATLAPAASVAPVVTVGSMRIQGTTVTANGKVYTLVPISGLASPGLYAVEGTLTQVIPNPGTKSNTPYYVVIQNNGSPAIVGIVVPAGDAKDFNASTIPVGSNVLVAGTVFPSADQVGVFTYAQLIQALHVAPGLQQLTVPPGTPFIGADFRNIGIVG